MREGESSQETPGGLWVSGSENLQKSRGRRFKVSPRRLLKVKCLLLEKKSASLEEKLRVKG